MLSKSEMQIKKWEVIGHSWAIADTGDYDGYFELTNGDISLRTDDDDQETLEFIASTLNFLGVDLKMDHKYANELHELHLENQMLKQVLADNGITRW